MRKIKDRFTLGIIAGLGGTVAKGLVMSIFRKLKWAEFNGPETAAGLLLPAHKISTTKGKIVGNIADFSVGCLLGVGTTYLLSFTGKDKAILKGMATGDAAWSTLYGIFGNFGATTVKPASPSTVLSQMFAHSVYGVVTSAIATRLGDPRLFTGKTPINASSSKNIALKSENNVFAPILQSEETYAHDL